MKKFKLLALALVIGTASLFAASVNVIDEPELDAAYEAEMLHNEAYGDADFYKKLQQENEAHSNDIIYRAKNLNTATIKDDNQGLETFYEHLNDNYKKYLEEDISIDDININDEKSDQYFDLCAGIEIMGETVKLHSREKDS
jgi:hypothetical protein